MPSTPLSPPLRHANRNGERKKSTVELIKVLVEGEKKVYQYVSLGDLWFEKSPKKRERRIILKDRVVPLLALPKLCFLCRFYCAAQTC